MFRFNFHLKSAILNLIFLSLTAGLFSQQAEKDIAGLKEKAAASYEAGDYSGALENYRALIRKFPKDPMYNYYAGTCLVKMNRDLDDAISFLKFASNSTAPVDAYYQLALACQREYLFEDAHEAILEFRDRATRHELKEVDTDLFIASLKKAYDLTKTYNPYEVLNVTFLDMSDSVDFSQVKMKGGVLSRKPDAFFTGEESRVDLNSLMFIPQQVEKNEYVYFSGLSRSGKNGFQIFRVRKGLKATWGTPEEVSALNTAGDEILPYYDPIGKDIYYATDGLPGVGGFDVFKSHYDEEQNEWTAPVNMGFPINSSADEYLLLPGSDLGMEMFFSTRQGTDSTVTVYRVHFSEPRKPVGSDDPAKIRQIANLGNVAAESLEQLEEDIARTDNEVKPLKTAAALDAQAELKTEAPKIQKMVPAEHPSANTAYQKTLREALNLQSEADSLAGLATDARVKVRDSDDPNDRWLYQKQILVWEKRAVEAQGIADSCYALLATLDRNVPVAELPDAIEKDTVINDLTVYRYKDQTSDNTTPEQVKGEPGEIVQEVIIEDKAPVEESNSVINRFEILASSPYNQVNPIPLNIQLPAGSFYRIQLGAYSKPVENSAFGGIIPITGEEFPERGLIKYYAGKFSRYSDAQVALNHLRTNGYPDAYIVAWYNGTQMSVSKAKELEL